MDRFRTLPPQDVVLPYVREHVARGSLRRVEGGWTWKFDPDFFGRRLLLRDLLPAAGTPGPCSAASTAWSARRWRRR